MNVAYLLLPTCFYKFSEDSPISSKLEGNVAGLKQSQIKALERLSQRRYIADCGYSIEQARELAALSRIISRQIGLIIDRQGRVKLTIIGDAMQIVIPALGSHQSTLRGLRLLHTHLSPDLLSHEDLMDLLFLRLDSLSVLTVNEYGEPASFQTAHLLPKVVDEPYSVSSVYAWDRVELDLNAQTKAIESEFSKLAELNRLDKNLANAILVSVSTAPKLLQEQNLAELTELANSAGLNVCGNLIQRVQSINPRHLLGKGKLAELEVLALQGNASVVVFDGELTPAQLNNLSELTERKVIDRTQLILDIFAQRAKTKEGKLQVELAQLNYTLPRLVGKNKAMDRLMGGIGGRGPGETKLETDRRKIRTRVTKVKDELEGVKKQRSINRAGRKRNNLPVAALVGYTNAGKSTLLNALTKAEVLAENKLFATLDPTTRRMRIPEDRELVLADTVGFIRNLPKDLQEAFRATLEELEAADVLIHVLDAAHHESDRQFAAVEYILSEMKLIELAKIVVLNKCDLLSDEELLILKEKYPKAIIVSAVKGQGFEELLEELCTLV